MSDSNSAPAPISDALRSQLTPLLAAELKRMNGEDADENLLDYLLLLVTTGPPEQSISKDLVDFFGEDLAASLAKFIVNLYQKYVLAPQTAQSPQKAAAPQSNSKKVVSLKRTRDPSPPRAASSLSPAATSFSRKPEQARYQPGQGKLKAANESAVVGGRVAPMNARGGLSSVVVMHKKGAANGSTAEEEAQQPPNKKQRQIKKRGEDEEASDNRMATENNNTQFKITFDGKNRTASAGSAFAKAAGNQSADKPRLVITKGGKQLAGGGGANDEAAGPAPMKIVRRNGEAAAAPVVAPAVAPAAARRSFGSGFNAAAAAAAVSAAAAPIPAQPQEEQVIEDDEEIYEEEEQPRAPQQQQPSAFGGGAAFPTAFGQAPSAFGQMPFPSAFNAGNPAASAPVKCRFFPNCTKADCPFVHPTQLCSFFPNCHLGAACLNLHPTVPCRYGDNCTNATCSFSHPPTRSVPSAPRGGRGAAMSARGGGRGGFHGAPASASTEASSAFAPSMRGGRGGARGGRGGVTNMLKLAATPCRYGDACTRDDCIYSHPSGKASRVTANQAHLDLSAPFSAQ